ncbi:hypothetical protein AX17_001349 [Amanita inopinata Kibby_2008]|nr:hypothetical protein AX17_001349 [Amanita inopinata Kibby_2008]
MSSRKPVVVVTGASKGIGLAVTEILLQKFHANVAALARTKTECLDALSCDSLVFISCDVTNEKALENAIASVRETYHHIDGLVLNAGTLDPLCKIGDSTPLLAWKSHFDVNFFSLVTTIKFALPALRESEIGGRVIFVSSGAAVKGTAGWGPYNTSKAAMNSLCRTLAAEEPNVVSVAVRPGMVDTEMQRALRATGSSHMDKAVHDFFVRAHADGKLVQPEDCGYVIASLALSAPKELSGEFVGWDSDVCEPFRKD